MTSSVRFTPLCDPQRESALCYLLTIDDYNILLDCGWTDGFDPSLLGALSPIAPSVDAVLVSHPDIPHLGALPYAFSKLGLDCDVFSTIPVHKMGQMFMYDAHESKCQREKFDLFSLDDVDSAFDRFKTLKYLQRFSLQGKGRGIEVTPYPAGHMIGGTVWRVTRDAEDIVYAVDFNHGKDRHLNGTVLETIKRPSVMIADAKNALAALPSRKERDRELFDAVLGTLRGGGNVLLPVDTSGRSLELALLLEQQWSFQKLGGYTVALLTYVSDTTVSFARSQLEWMSDAVSKEFDRTRGNPFAFKFVRLVHSAEELAALPKPACILASGCTLSSGFSRDLFAEWCGDAKNLVLFTDRGTDASLARSIIDRLPSPPRELTLLMHRSTVIKEDKDAAEAIPRDVVPASAGQSESPGASAGVAPKVESEVKTEDGNSAPPVEKEIAGVNPLVDSFDAVPSEFARRGFKFPIFPATSLKAAVAAASARAPDAFGEVINPDDFMLDEEKEQAEKEKQRILEEEEQRKAAAALQESPIHELEEQLRPVARAYTTEEKTLSIGCRMKYVDFEGRSDGKSIRNILTHVSPRKLILVNGTAAAVSHLSEWCEGNIRGLSKPVHCPSAAGEAVDITSETRVHRVAIKEALFQSTAFAKSGEYDVAFVDAVIEPPASAAVDSAMDGTAPAAADASTLNVLAPAQKERGGAAKVPWHDSVYIGDPKLYDVRAVLSKQGFRVQFARGNLFVNDGQIVVSKTEPEDGSSSLVTVEGALCDDYFRVRDIVRSQFTVV